MPLKSYATLSISLSLLLGLCVMPVSAQEQVAGSETVQPAFSATEAELNAAEDAEINAQIESQVQNAIQGRNDNQGQNATISPDGEPNPKFNQPDPPVEKTTLDELPQLDRPTPQIGQVYEELVGDLDRDGRPERVALIPFVQDDEGNIFMQLTVYNDKNEMIWRSPRLTDPAKKRTFGLYNYGTCNLQLLCDLDKDGFVDLVESLPRSDVRPMPYRIWKWDGDKFVYQFDASLEQDKNNNELFLWNTKQWDGEYVVTWLDGLRSKNGQIYSDVIRYNHGRVSTGNAYFGVTDKRGFKVNRWAKHLVDVKF